MTISRDSKTEGQSVDIVVAYQQLSPEEIEDREAWTGTKHHLTIKN